LLVITTSLNDRRQKNSDYDLNPVVKLVQNIIVASYEPNDGFLWGKYLMNS